MLSHIEKRFLYYTECQLATLEDARERKRFPKCEVERHERIAAGMLAECKSLLGSGAVVWQEAKAMGLPRTIRRLADY